MGKISNYTRVALSKLTDLFVVDQTDNNVTATKSVTVEQIGDTIAGTQVHSALTTSDKTLIGAIKEVAKDKNIADEYDDTHTYNTGDITIYGNTLYVCQDDNVTGAWDSTKWSATTVDDLIPKTDNNLPHYTGTPTAGTTAEAIDGKANKLTRKKYSVTLASNPYVPPFTYFYGLDITSDRATYGLPVGVWCDNAGVIAHIQNANRVDLSANSELTCDVYVLYCSNVNVIS